jgi:hypothetical protein
VWQTAQGNAPEEGLTKAARFLNEIVIEQSTTAPWWVDNVAT